MQDESGPRLQCRSAKLLSVYVQSAVYNGEVGETVQPIQQLGRRLVCTCFRLTFRA